MPFNFKDRINNKIEKLNLDSNYLYFYVIKCLEMIYFYIFKPYTL